VANRFKPNPRGIAELARTPEMVDMLESVATTAAKNSQSIAPEDSTPPHYKDQIRPTAGVDGDTARGRVNAFKETSNLIEFGTEDTPTFAPLRRGIEMTGLRLKAR
jgi:hypothetical protein